MIFKNIAIESLAYHLPDEVWSSEYIERCLEPLYERLHLPQGRLELMTGIQERRMWPQNTRPSQAAILAGKKALQQSLIDPKKIEVLVHAGVCRDHLEPATAAYVHKALGLAEDVQILDISNACLGFLNAMVMLSGLIESGSIQAGMIVAGENGRPLVERTLEILLNNTLDRQQIKPYFANLTIGSGAAAMIVCHSKLAHKDALKLGGAVVRTNTHASTLCEGNHTDTGMLDMQTDSEGLLEAGIILAKDTWNVFKKELHWAQDTPDTIVCHQVGKQHRNRLYQALELPLEKDISSYPYLGNVGSVSWPITLAIGLEQKTIVQGDAVAILGIGSGLSCMMGGLWA